MSEPLFLAVDQGTTQVKAMLVDAALNPVAETRRPTAVSHPRPGWVEKDPAEVLGAVVDAVAELLDAAPRPVTAAGLDHEGESVLAWRASTGEPLTPIIVWQDKRAEEVLERLGAEGRGRATEISGLPCDPYFSAGKVAWLLEKDEAVSHALADGDLRIGTVDSFLSDRLGAGFSTDASTASRTLLAAPGDPGWNRELLELFSVPEGILPVVGDTVGELGELSHPRWPQALALTARCVDQQAALAGSGCVAPGPVKATYGTGVFVLAVTGSEPPQPGSGLLPTVAWRIGGRDTFALDGGVFSAGAMLEWLCGALSLAESPEELGQMARETPDSGGVMVLPALAGLGAPWWRPEARAVIAGLTGQSSRGEIARAALEGIAWRVADIVEAIEASQPVASLRVDGGLTREPLLAQLQADAIGRPVEQLEADSTAIGAAALAAVGARALESVEAIGGLIKTGTPVRPLVADNEREAQRERRRRFVEGASALEAQGTATDPDAGR